MDTVKARLDRDARRGRNGRVICGYHDCNNPIALVLLGSAGVTVVPGAVPGHIDYVKTAAPRYLFFDIEWECKSNGIMERTKHQWQGITAVRSKKQMQYRHENALQVIDSFESHKGLRISVEPRYLRVPPRLPIPVRCDLCGRLQLLDPDCLKVELFQPPAALTADVSVEDFLGDLRKRGASEQAIASIAEPLADWKPSPEHIEDYARRGRIIMWVDGLGPLLFGVEGLFFDPA